MNVSVGRGNSLLFIFLSGRCPFCLDSNLFLFPFQENFLVVSYYHQPIIRLLWRGEDKRKRKRLDCWVESLLFAVGWSCHRDRSVDRASFDIKFPLFHFFDLRTCRFDFLFDEQTYHLQQSNPPLDCPLSLKRINFSFLSVWCASWVLHLHNVSP